jgi:hypothetical protein
VLQLAEDQYKFGVGPLVCRVGTVIARVTFDGRPWWHLRGECKLGTLDTLQEVVRWSQRELYVDAAALTARTLRRPSPNDGPRPSRPPAPDRPQRPALPH